MKVYLSGPISGRDRDKVEAMFSVASNRLRSLGYTVVSPLYNGLNRNSSWEDHMLRDIKLLMDCECVYFLCGWELSRGARIERKVAEEMQIKILNSTVNVDSDLLCWL